MDFVADGLQEGKREEALSSQRSALGPFGALSIENMNCPRRDRCRVTERSKG